VERERSPTGGNNGLGLSVRCRLVHVGEGNVRARAGQTGGEPGADLPAGAGYYRDPPVQAEQCPEGGQRDRAGARVQVYPSALRRSAWTPSHAA
jgi:hypothetical protein